MITKTPIIRSNIKLTNGIKIGKRVKDHFYDTYDKDVLVKLKERYGRKVVADAWEQETWVEFEDTFSLAINFPEYEINNRKI